MISEVHIFGITLTKRYLEYQDYQKCTVKLLHKCFSRHQVEALVHCIFHMEKYLGPERGTPLQGEYFLKRSFKEFYAIGFLYMIYSLEHITLRAQTVS